MKLPFIVLGMKICDSSLYQKLIRTRITMLFFALLVYHLKSIIAKKPRSWLGITYDPSSLPCFESLGVVNSALIDSPGVAGSVLQTQL